MRSAIDRAIRPLILVMLPTAAFAQTVVENGTGPYVHAQTGMTFPAVAGGGTRHRIDRFDADGSDSGIGYQVARNGKMVAYLTIFVYPAPVLDRDTPAERKRACAQLSDGIKRDISGHESEARLVDSGPIDAPFGGTNVTGLRIGYVGGHVAFDGVDQPVSERNDLYCFAGGRWLVAYRVTMPAGVDASDDVARVVRAIAWPASLTRASN